MYPSYINNKSNNSSSTINQQWTTSSCFYNHEDPNFKPANMQSTIEKSSNNNGKFIVADSVTCFNMSHVILENNCLTGNRSSKKDRHSKINTVRGPRDRRMRLSLDVATKFFMLQDLLDFDKASNTIEWLLEKSKPAIRDLQTQQFNQSFSFMDVSNSQSSVSECEVLSGINDQSMEKTGDQDKVIIKEKKKIQRGVRKSVYIDHSLAKETREKARARARKRTTEKRKIKLFDYEFSKLRPSLDETMDQNTTPALGSWIPFGENQVQLTDPSSHDKRGMVGDIICSSSMMSTCNWSPSFLLGHQHNPA